MYSGMFNKDFLYRCTLHKDNPGLVIFDNDGERITLRQGYVSFSSGFILGVFFVRFLSDLRQTMIAAKSPHRQCEISALTQKFLTFGIFLRKSGTYYCFS